MVHVPVKRLGEQQGGGHLKTIENYSEDEKYMALAMKLAKKGYGYTAPNPVVGAVIVKNGCIIGQGYHEKYGEPHAERNALASCTQSPEGATIYVTLEPCQMCAGAIVQARIPEVMIGCMNPKAGCAGSIYNLLQEPAFNHQVSLFKGVLEEECSQMLKDFFRSLRTRLKT